jgi:hypothetical protein
MSSQLQAQLERLYKLEVNVTLSSDWDNQWTVSLGNKLNPATETSGLTLDEVVEWLSTKHLNNA